MKKMHVVFNTCGITKKENSAYYIKAIQSILDQDFDDFTVVMSSCLNSEETRSKVISEFGDKIKYNFIDYTLPVNVTFNHAVLQTVERFGEADCYTYIDSGVV